MIRFKCPICAYNIQIDNHFGGNRIICAVCGEQLQIPYVDSQKTVALNNDSPNQYHSTSQTENPNVKTSASKLNLPTKHDSQHPLSNTTKPKPNSSRAFAGCFLLFIATFFAIAGIQSCFPSQNNSTTNSYYNTQMIEVISVRLEPYRTATGLDTEMVHIDWKNSGKETVRTVSATIHVFDISGKEIRTISNYPIFAVFGDRPGVQPGETYRVPYGEGHILGKVPGEVPHRATADITKATEKGIE